MEGKQKRTVYYSVFYNTELHRSASPQSLFKKHYINRVDHSLLSKPCIAAESHYEFSHTSRSLHLNRGSQMIMQQSNERLLGDVL